MKKVLALLFIIGTFSSFASHSVESDSEYCRLKLDSILKLVRHNTNTAALLNMSDESKETFIKTENGHAADFLSECSL